MTAIATNDIEVTLTFSWYFSLIISSSSSSSYETVDTYVYANWMWLNKCSRTQIWTHHPYSQCILHVESKLKYRLFFILLDHIIRFWQKSLSLFPFLVLLKSDVVHFSHSIRRIEGHIRLELVQVNKSFELIHSSQWHSALFELLFERFQVGERSKTHYFSNFSSGLVEFVNKRMLSNCNLTIN